MLSVNQLLNRRKANFSWKNNLKEHQVLGSEQLLFQAVNREEAPLVVVAPRQSFSPALEEKSLAQSTWIKTMWTRLQVEYSIVLSEKLLE